MYLADFHMHSTFSDGKLTIPQLVDLYGSRGFGAIAITDHLCETHTLMGKAATYLGRTLTEATFPLYIEILKSEAERAWRQYRMVVLPGLEITKNSLSNSRSAHVLAIGSQILFNANQDILKVTRDIRASGGLAIAAHPVSTRKLEKQTYHLWDRREELRNEFDAWEVASGQHLFEEVLKSDLPKLANSDLHVRKQFNSWKTVLTCERHPEAILDAIRKQDLSFEYYDEVMHYDLRHSLGLADLGISIGANPARYCRLPKQA
jgi:hypothetical protein